MNIAYILSSEDLSVKDVFQFNDFDFKFDIDFAEKSMIGLSRKPIIDTGDYIVTKEFKGICVTCENESGNNYHIITAQQMENLFDCRVLLQGQSVIASTGIEDFIKNTIENEFISSDDTAFNKPYLSVVCQTHTPLNIAVDNENGIYNLKTFLGNAKQYYGIFLDFDFVDDNGDRSIVIRVSKKTHNPLKIDTKISDIINYVEIYDVSVLAKLKVVWKIPDVVEEGLTTIGDTTILNYYLLNDRTITTNKDNPNRAKGNADVIYIETETFAEAQQEAYNKFASNSYNHSVEADFYNNSKVYPQCDLYVGHPCEIKTKRGVQNSIITYSGINSNSDLIHIKFGNLKVTLIEKLRGK